MSDDSEVEIAMEAPLSVLERASITEIKRSVPDVADQASATALVSPLPAEVRLITEKPGDDMSWREFAAAVLPSAAWPILIGALALMFRREIRLLLRRMRSVHTPIGEVMFNAALLAAEALAPAAAAEVGMDAPTPIKKPTDESRPTPRETVNKPSAAPSTSELLERDQERRGRLAPAHRMLIAWDEVEVILTQLAVAVGLKPGGPFGVRMHRLQSAGGISELTTRLVFEMFKARNAAVHSGDEPLTTEQADAFVRQVDELLQILQHRLDSIQSKQ